MRPRASRIPGVRDHESSARSLHYSSKVSKWLDDDYLVRRGRVTNWKRLYKLRHNWSRGSANISETKVADRPSIPPLLVCLHNGIVIIAESTSGLKAYQLEGDPTDRLIASTDLSRGLNLGQTRILPTSLAIDSANTIPHEVDISLGFDDGGFSIYTLSRKERAIHRRYVHSPSRNGSIRSIAYSSPYLLTISGAQLLSMYRFERKSLNESALSSPILLSSLRSHTAHPPVSLAIRVSLTSVVASIAYAIPTWTTAWSVGLQELRLTRKGAILDSRMASATGCPLAHSLSGINQNAPSLLQRMKTSSGQDRPVASLQTAVKPTSLSYNHPYLLSAHADNTLTLYMVTSNAKELVVGAGNRLWGHTSSISGAHVGERGKAVSVSAVGNEIRVWELEGIITSSASRRRATAGGSSIQVQPKTTETEKSRAGRAFEACGYIDTKSTESSALGTVDEPAISQGWVSFDEEKVVLLREKMKGAQALVVYDFS